MKFMTQEEFETKWGNKGKTVRGTTWELDCRGDIRYEPSYGPGHESQYSGWDAYLSATGVLPPDPRDEVFKSYGFEFIPKTPSTDNDRWVHGTGTVVYKGSCDVYVSGIYTAITVKTAKQAEYLCKLLGLQRTL